MTAPDPTHASTDISSAAPNSMACEIVSHRTVEPLVAARGTACVIDFLMQTPFAFDLEFRVWAGGGAPVRAAWVIGGVDGAHASQMAELVRNAVTSFTPWCGLGLAVPTASLGVGASDGVSDVVTHRLVPASLSVPTVSHGFAPAWRLAERCTQPVELSIRIRSSTNGPLTSAVDARVSVRGSSTDSALVAGALVVDAIPETSLEMRRSTSGDETWTTFPLGAAGWLVSTPARIGERWPVDEPGTPDQLMDLLATSTSPHVAVFGGSGSGKTTLTEHLVSDSISRDETVVVLCRHGDLPVRAAQILADLGTEFDAVDFANQESPARWSVLSPPRLVPLDAWLAFVPEIVLALWREQHDLSGLMAGPMWYQSFNPMVRIGAADPDGPLPITRLRELIEGDLPRRWQAIASDAGLGEALRDLESTRTAIANDREKHYLPWLLSKLSVFTKTDAMRRLTEQRASSFDLSAVVEGQSFLAAIPSTVLGDDGASIVATGLLTQLRAIALQRPGKGRRVRVFVDEAHLVDPSLLRWILAEGRKFGLALTIITQSPRLLEGDLLSSVLANAGVLATFRVGPADAALLDQRFPEVTVGAMQRLPRHTVAATDSERDIVCPAPPPIADPDDRGLFDAQHWMTLHDDDPDSQPPAIRPTRHRSPLNSDDATEGNPSDKVPDETTFESTLRSVLRP